MIVNVFGRAAAVTWRVGAGAGIIKRMLMEGGSVQAAPLWEAFQGLT